MIDTAMPERFSVRPERHTDFDAVGSLLRAAFPGPAEAKLVDRLRSDGDVFLALVAADRAEAVVGYAAFPRLILDNDDTAAALAPLAVAAGFRRRGIGAALVREGIERLRGAGRSIIFVLGEPTYYRRFGFDTAAAAPFDSPYAGPYFMALRLADDAPAGGGIRYPPAFATLE